MAYFSQEEIERAKELDLLSYLRHYEPDELVHFSGNTYCTKTHDSLKISNGKWYWFSRSIGGKSALDYLIKVRKMSFVDAISAISGKPGHPFSSDFHEKPGQKQAVQAEKSLRLPQKNQDCRRIFWYLQRRGIDRELIQVCVSSGQIYESYHQHSVVFVGFDEKNAPRYAAIRGTDSSFKGEAFGSNKRFSFCLSAKSSETVQIFESAIDLLSYATMMKKAGRSWQSQHLLSLAGIYKPSPHREKITIPPALARFLVEHPGIKKLVLRLDNDDAGRSAAQAIQAALQEKYEVQIRLPPEGKDYNECLCLRLGLSPTSHQGKER